MYLKLHSGAAAGMQPPLLVPSLPHIDPASVYSKLFEVDPATISSQPQLWNGLAGTPLVGLLSTTGRPWAGYYTVLRTRARSLPMFFELRSSNTPLDAETEYVYFLSEGQESRATVWGHLPPKLVQHPDGHGQGGQGAHGCGSLELNNAVFDGRNVGQMGGHTGWWWVWPREWGSTAADVPSGH